MAPRRAKVNKFDYKKLSANDVICPICRSILIKPITLPCSHGFCSSCFETTQNANVVCPLCRVRVGSWLRSATKSKKLINETFWQAIQDLFPLEVKNKLNTPGGAKEKFKMQGEVGEKLKPDLQIYKIGTSVKTQSDKICMSTIPSTSVKSSVKSTMSKNQNQSLLINSEKNEKRPFINNFATKEYTCRILCQNVDPKETQKNIFKESQNIIQKKNKRILEITELETSNDRSNSIESECLYFKPIDYRHNPPSEGLAPIKVPTRKPNVSQNVKILAPSGQNQLNINHLESAFARLCSPILQQGKVQLHKKENVDSLVQEDKSVMSTKRKHDKYENKAKKKTKTNYKSVEIQKSQEIFDGTISACDTKNCKTENSNLSVTKVNDIRDVAKLNQSSGSLTAEESLKRTLQEQADFELATKLQQTYNQSFKYSTRSTVLKRMATKNQVKMEGIMTPYKVK